MMDKFNIKEEFEEYTGLSDYEVDRLRDQKIEELNQDPTIAIIDWNIKTEEELNKVYNKYSLLPRKFKRFSNYYSTQLLGYNVPNMYALVMDKLIDNDYIFGKNDEMELTQESVDILNENFIKQEPDLYYNKKAFDNGDINICFILGYSGGGKTSLAKYITNNNNIEITHLDDLINAKDHFSIDELKQQSELLYKFFTTKGKEYYISKSDKKNKDIYKDIFEKFIKFSIDFSNSHKNKKFIIEGIWIYIYFNDPKYFSKYAVYIKGTSLVKSKFYYIKRELKGLKNDGMKYLIGRIKDFAPFLKETMFNTKVIDKYRDYYKDLPETEKSDNIYYKNENYIVGEYLSLIDEYFVEEKDFEQLYESMMNDSELSVKEKAMLEVEIYNANKDMISSSSNNSVLPWFTLDEGYTKEEMFTDPEYSSKLSEACNQYKYNPSEENKNKLIGLGWNPSLPLNEDTIKRANNRQKNWFREKGKSIEDLTK